MIIFGEKISWGTFYQCNPWVAGLFRWPLLTPHSLKLTPHIKKVAKIRDFPGGPVVKTLHSQYKGAGVRFLVRELDSCMLQLRSDVAKFKKKKSRKKTSLASDVDFPEGFSRRWREGLHYQAQGKVSSNCGLALTVLIHPVDSSPVPLQLSFPLLPSAPVPTSSPTASKHPLCWSSQFSSCLCTHTSSGKTKARWGPQGWPTVSPPAHFTGAPPLSCHVQKAKPPFWTRSWTVILKGRGKKLRPVAFNHNLVKAILMRIKWIWSR